MADQSPSPEPRYAGFWIRLVSIILDVLILSPIGLLEVWLIKRDRLFYSLACIAYYGANVFSFVFLVKRRGGSPGKLLSGLKIVTSDFKSVGWKEAWLREGVGLGISILSTAVYFIAMARLSKNEFLHLGFTERGRRIDELGGIAMMMTAWLFRGWYASELIVLLTNRRRRALHDFIAGTVVIREGKDPGCFLGIIALLGVVIMFYAMMWLNRTS
jgi:uncharacterized RDD family membrane protein YckC